MLEGGAGVDWALDNTGLASGITIDLFSEIQIAGGGGVETLHEIENVMATSFADLLTGNNLANELRGEGGNDWIWGNGGNDVVNGGAGDDAVAGGTGADDVIGGARQRPPLGRRTPMTSSSRTAGATTGSGTSSPAPTRSTCPLSPGLNNINQLEVENTQRRALQLRLAARSCWLGSRPCPSSTTDFISDPGNDGQHAGARVADSPGAGFGYCFD